MKHPLTRIFAPISVIVLIAVFTVAVATFDTSDRLSVSSVTVATAATQTDRSAVANVNQSAAAPRD